MLGLLVALLILVLLFQLLAIGLLFTNRISQKEAVTTNEGQSLAKANTLLNNQSAEISALKELIKEEKKLNQERIDEINKSLLSIPSDNITKLKELIEEERQQSREEVLSVMNIIKEKSENLTAILEEERRLHQENIDELGQLLIHKVNATKRILNIHTGNITELKELLEEERQQSRHEARLLVDFIREVYENTTAIQTLFEEERRLNQENIYELSQQLILKINSTHSALLSILLI